MKKNLLKTILLVGPTIPIRYFIWMRKYRVHKDKYSMKEKYSKLRKLTFHLTKHLDFEIHAYGVENVPNETCAFFSNHLAAVDPLVYIRTLDKPMTFLAKSELESVPFVKTAIEDIEGLFLKRDDLKQSLRTMMAIEADLKEGRKNWLIFPEGTRNKDDRALLLEFHHGTFRPAMKAKVPLVPAAVFGTQRIIPGPVKTKKYPIQLVIGKPIYPNEYENLSTQEVAAIVQSRVQQMLTYVARKNDRAELSKKLGDKFKDNL